MEYKNKFFVLVDDEGNYRPTVGIYPAYDNLAKYILEDIRVQLAKKGFKNWSYKLIKITEL